MAMPKGEMIELVVERLETSTTPVEILETMKWMYQTWLPLVRRNVKLDPRTEERIQTIKNIREHDARR